MSSTDPTTGPAASADPLPAPLGAWPAGQPRVALVAAVAAALPDAGAPVAVAVSGGPDSAGLLRLAADAVGDRPLVALHVRHGLRDDAGDRDRARAQAAAVGAAFHEVAVTVAPRGDGVAAAARRARLDALADAARNAGAGDVLLAHTADDRAETIVLNVARGTGPGGLAAMPARRAHRGVWLHHPLRSVRRADLRAVAGEGPEPVSDPSNTDRRRRRTRARQDALPALASLSGGPGDPVAALTRLGDLAADDDAALEELAVRELARLRRDWGPAVALDAAGMAELPVALARRVVRRVLAEVAGATPSAEAVEAVRRLPPGRRRTVDGGVAVARQGRWLLARPEAGPALLPRSVAAPGDATLTPLALWLRVRRVCEEPAPAALPAVPSTHRTVPGVMALTGPALVRARAVGDRLRLDGVDRPVTEVLRRTGVPGLLRDLVPVVVDADGRVAGLVGVAAADPPGRPAWRAWSEPPSLAWPARRSDEPGWRPGASQVGDAGDPRPGQERP